MFKTILTKTLFEKRWGILWWTLAIFATTLLVVLMFPVFQDSFGQQLNDVPDSLKSILGEASDYQRIEGFIELQVFMQIIFFTVIYGIILMTGLMAGEENEGTLQTLLSHPVSRTRVYFEKLAAAAIILLIVCLGMFLGIWIGGAAIGEPVSVLRALEGTFAMWLTTMAFSLVGYALGAIMGRRGLAGAFAGAFAFLMYMVSSLVATVDALKPVNYFSPLKYFNNPRIMEQGLYIPNVLVLTIGCAALILAGWLVFRKRDVFQR